MTHHRLVVERADGGIVVIAIAAKSRGEGEEEAAWLARVKARTLQGNDKYRGARELPDAALPASRRFRDCWRCDGADGVHVDMPLARGQRMAEIRRARNAKLAETDGPMLRAQEQADTATVDGLKAKRQALRDLPNQLEAAGALDAIATPEELEAFEPTWPEEGK